MQVNSGSIKNKIRTVFRFINNLGGGTADKCYAINLHYLCKGPRYDDFCPHKPDITAPQMTCRVMKH